MLHQRYSLDDLAGLLIPRADYRPHPTIEDRAAWRALPGPVRAAHLQRAEAYLGYDYPSLPATLFLQYSRMGDRRNYERPHFERRGTLEMLVTAECIEGEGRFLDDIANGIWAICEETYWGVPAHTRVQQAGNTLPDAAEPTVDLFAAETGNLIAWTYYLLGNRLDSVSPIVRERMALELDRRILTPLYERDDFHWMGFWLRSDQRRVNNWNPWICSNWLSAVLLMETDETRRTATVHKIMRAVDNFIDPYPTDGGCDEGPSYWGRAGASLFDNLELLHSATRGQIDLYGESLIQEIGRFVYRVHIDEDYYINFADAPALVHPDGVLVYRYGERMGDPQMMQHGLWLAQRKKLTERGYVADGDIRQNNFQRLLRGLFSLAELPTEPVAPPMPRDVWLPVIEVLVARDKAGSAEGFAVAAKGGHNNESHNHNDIGNFVVYRDGKPLLVDAGVETYTAKTFGPQRYDIWTMQSAYHSLLPTVDGVMQSPGVSFAAADVDYQADDAAAELSLEIAGSYPAEAKIAAWRRSVRLERGAGVTIRDDYALTAPAGEVTVSLVTPCAVDVSQLGIVSLRERATLDGRVSGVGQVEYDPAVFTAVVETIPLTDERMGGTWGTELYRVVLTAKNPAQKGTWTYRVTS
ncbi:MAG: heparinase II/III family protein [Chloroflexi bacterium]|nr:heparinase II/III family protein [Chloroflexota bacterium]